MARQTVVKNNTFGQYLRAQREELGMTCADCGSRGVELGLLKQGRESTWRNMEMIPRANISKTTVDLAIAILDLDPTEAYLQAGLKPPSEFQGSGMDVLLQHQYRCLLDHQKKAVDMMITGFHEDNQKTLRKLNV